MEEIVEDESGKKDGEDEEKPHPMHALQKMSHPDTGTEWRKKANEDVELAAQGTIITSFLSRVHIVMQLMMSIDYEQFRSIFFYTAENLMLILKTCWW